MTANDSDAHHLREYLATNLMGIALCATRHAAMPIKQPARNALEYLAQ